MHSFENCEASTAVEGEAALSSSVDRKLRNHRGGIIPWCQHKDVSWRSYPEVGPGKPKCADKKLTVTTLSLITSSFAHVTSFDRSNSRGARSQGDLQEKTMRGDPAQKDYMNT